MDSIRTVIGRQLLDSRGMPTVECQVILESGLTASAMVPSGASTGTHEAHELRDHNDNVFQGLGVLKAVNNINDILAPKLIGFDPELQAEVDSLLIELDGTEQKNNLGANALLAVSLAVAKVAAARDRVPFYYYLGGDDAITMPVPMMNLINGGQHARNNLDVQEFMIVPAGFKSFQESLRCGVEVFYALKALLIERGLSTSVGDEGGFAPQLSSNKLALDLLVDAIIKAGYHPGDQVSLALDIASSEMYKSGRYSLENEGKSYSIDGWVDLMAEWVDEYPIISIEDGMAENDMRGWALLTKILGGEVQLVGDDVFVTNKKRFKKGIESKIANCILIKLNQVGTLTETLETMALAKRSHYNTVISHRSGETEDTSIADLAVATNSGLIKTGGLCRTDRIAKYNQLLRIEEMLGNRAVFLGKKVLQFGLQPSKDFQ